MEGVRRWVESAEGTVRRGRATTLFVGLYLVFVGSYLPLNHFSIGRPAWQISLPGEQSIPFVPEFEFLYVLGYLFPVLPIIYVTDSVRLIRLLRAVLLTLAIAYVFFLLFPVHLPRPELTVDSLATALVRLEYQDPPYNNFPSLHVAFTWLVYFAIRPTLKRRWPLLLLAAGITISTVFVKQHYLLDLPAGLVLATVAWRWSAPVTDEPRNPHHRVGPAGPPAVG